MRKKQTSKPLWQGYLNDLIFQIFMFYIIKACLNSIYFFLYHEDLEKRGGCGVMSHARQTSSHISPLSKILMIDENDSYIFILNPGRL